MAHNDLHRPNVLVTVGDPCGVGPELLVALLGRSTPPAKTRFKILAPMELFEDVSHHLAAIDSHWAHCVDRFWAGRGDRFSFVEEVETPTRYRPGEWLEKNVPFIESSLRLGTAEAVSTGAPLVTGPVDKRSFVAMGLPESGHTEFLAKVSGGLNPVMLFDSPEIRVVILTRHIPLSRVESEVSRSLLEHGVRVVGNFRRRLAGRIDGYEAPMALVGLDPHCGEWGHITDTDLKVRGWVDILKGSGIDLEGPFPADTLFTPDKVKGYSVIFCWYHDQGMIPVKLLAFRGAVNVTLGLPLVRTSPAHGTAFDIAGKGIALADSVERAIAVAQILKSPRVDP